MCDGIIDHIMCLLGTFNGRYPALMEQITHFSYPERKGFKFSNVM